MTKKSILEIVGVLGAAGTLYQLFGEKLIWVVILLISILLFIYFFRFLFIKHKVTVGFVRSEKGIKDNKGINMESLLEIIDGFKILQFLKKMPKSYPKTFSFFVIILVVYLVLINIFISRPLDLAANAFAEEYDLRIDSGGWSIAWFDSKIINHGFKLYAKGSELPVLEIDEASLRFEFFDLVFKGWEGSLRSLYVKQPKLRLSYDVNGNSNWESIAEDKAVINALAKGKKVIEALSGEEPRVFLREVRFENMRVDWFRQNVDLSREVDAVHNKSVYIEDATFVAKNFEWPINAANDHQSLHFDGRLAGKKVTFDMKGALSIWRQEETNSKLIPAKAVVWRPKGLAEVILEDVDAYKLGYIMPSNGLVVRSGRVSGKIDFSTDESRLKVSGNLILDRVGISQAKSDIEGLGVQVIDDKVYTATGPKQYSFSGDLSDPGFQPILLIISSSREQFVDSENEKDLRIEMR